MDQELRSLTRVCDLEPNNLRAWDKLFSTLQRVGKPPKIISKDIPKRWHLPLQQWLMRQANVWVIASTYSEVSSERPLNFKICLTLKSPILETVPIYEKLSWDYYYNEEYAEYQPKIISHETRNKIIEIANRSPSYSVVLMQSLYDLSQHQSRILEEFNTYTLAYGTELVRLPISEYVLNALRKHQNILGFDADCMTSKNL